MEAITVSYLPIWNRYLDMFEKSKLTEAQVGTLVLAMMNYQFRDEEPEGMDPVLQAFWNFIVQDLQRAKVQYLNSVKNGKKGGRPRKNALVEETYTHENPEKPKTRTRTESTSKTESRERTKTAASTAAEDLSVCENAYGEFGWVKLTDEQYAQLEKTMGSWGLKQCIAYVDRSAQTTNNRNHWQDWSVVLRRCYEEGWHHTASRSQAVPTGASGHLGEAELEAIRTLMASK